MDDYLEILEWTLRAGHISPTAPDTLGKGGAPLCCPEAGAAGLRVPRGGLWGRVPLLTSAPAGCYPFYKSDPFILTDCPHVYFCGSAPRFQSKVITGESRPHPAPSSLAAAPGLAPDARLSPQGTRGSGSCWWRCPPSAPRRPPASSTCATSAASPSASPASGPRTMTGTWRSGSDGAARTLSPHGAAELPRCGTSSRWEKRRGAATNTAWFICVTKPRGGDWGRRREGPALGSATAPAEPRCWGPGLRPPCPAVVAPPGPWGRGRVSSPEPSPGDMLQLLAFGAGIGVAWPWSWQARRVGAAACPARARSAAEAGDGACSGQNSTKRERLEAGARERASSSHQSSRCRSRPW